MGNDEAAGKGSKITCQVCLKQIAESEARRRQAREYVHYFCSDECYQEWEESPDSWKTALTVTGLKVDFETAKALAETAAKKHAESAMLVAWFDRERGKESPVVPECQHKPGWFAYAESHGGNIKVDVNHGNYIFIFSS